MAYRFLRLTFSKKILAFPFRGFTVVNGIHGTMVLASHTHSAMTMPFRMAVVEGDVL
jgi:hypothetical protein